MREDVAAQRKGEEAQCEVCEVVKCAVASALDGLQGGKVDVVEDILV